MPPHPHAQYTANRLFTTPLLVFLAAVCGVTITPPTSAALPGVVTLTGESAGTWIERFRNSMASVLPAVNLLDDASTAWVLLQRIHAVFLSQGWPRGMSPTDVAKLRTNLDTAAALLAAPPAEVDPATASQAAAWVAELRAGLDQVYP